MVPIVKAEGVNVAVERKLQEVQLARIGAQLRDLSATRETLRALGEDPDAYAHNLGRQYADLSRKVRQSTTPAERGLSPVLSETLDRLADIFGWWNKIVAPNLSVVLAQTPTGPNAGGTFGADIINGNYLSFGGDMYAGAVEQWWIFTWQTIVQFPTTSSGLAGTASLAFRFNVPASLMFYTQNLVTGSVHAYVTVATTNNSNQRPIDFTHPASSQFSIATTLPAPGVPPMVDGTANVTGAIQLEAGSTPALGILLGMIVSIANGDALINPAENSFMYVVPPDATMPTDIGKIEYRQDPPFWVEGVAKMFTQ
jgi:hypothetical protein